MTKPYTQEDLSRIFDDDLTWRRKELSDLKSAIKVADPISKSALLKSLVAMSYAHWEGYVKVIAKKYFEHFTLRRQPYANFERQFYVNSMLARLDSISHSRGSIKERCQIINEILDNKESKFSYIHESLIDTKSNLNSQVIQDICKICSVDPSHFINEKDFIDVILLKRRNAIAHGQQENIQEEDMDAFINRVISLMEQFRDLLENKVYTKSYVA